MDIRDIKVGLIIDGKVYVPAPMQPACRGCDLFDTGCNGGEKRICGLVDRLTGKNNMLKLYGEKTQIEEGENGTDDNRD